jgi:hypothetical protein
VLPRDNVIEDMRETNCSVRQMTIFTPIEGEPPHLVFDLPIHGELSRGGLLTQREARLGLQNHEDVVGRQQIIEFDLLVFA